MKPVVTAESVTGFGPAARGIAAAAVDGATARIGDGRSPWESGVVAHLDGPATARSARTGMSVREFVDRLVADPPDTPRRRGDPARSRRFH